MQIFHFKYSIYDKLAQSWILGRILLDVDNVEYIERHFYGLLRNYHSGAALIRLGFRSIYGRTTHLNLFLLCEDFPSLRRCNQRDQEYSDLIDTEEAKDKDGQVPSNYNLPDFVRIKLVISLQGIILFLFLISVEIKQD